MKISGRLIAAGVVVLLGAPGVLAQGTITQGDVTYTRTNFTNAPDVNFTGVSPTLATDYLWEEGWWFRLPAGTAETAFLVPSTQNYVGAASTLTWASLGAGAFSAVENSVILDLDGPAGSSPSGSLTKTLTITNTSGAPLTLSIFHAADIDVNGAGTDVGALTFRNNHVRVTDAALSAEYRGVGAQAALAKPFGGGSVLGLLNDAAVSNFDNTTLPFPSGDITVGSQWNLSLATGGTASVTVVITPNASQVRGDFNDDAETDLVFRNSLFTRHVVWTMDGLTRTAGIFVTPDVAVTDNRLACTDDFTGDQKADLVFRNQLTNAVEFWAMGGPTGTDQQSVTPLGGTPPVLTTDWIIAACGDVNRDSKADLLWRNTVTQKLSVWLMDGVNFVSTLTPNPDQAVNANWQVTALLDYDADGNTDFLWYNTTSGNIVEWFMDPNFVRIFGAFTTPTNAGNNNWRVVASGDYDRGGRDLTPAEPVTNSGAGDMIWYNATSGRIVGWIMDGLAVNPTNGNTRLQGQFTCPTAVGGTCNPADPPPAGATNWVIVGPR